MVDTSRLLWWPLLRGVILPLRSPRVAKLYASVWMEDGSPLMVYSRQQQQALAQRLPDTPVALGHELRLAITGKAPSMNSWQSM
ncbi:ferrochelatase [Escherichia coli]|uniref:Ferrochelatase n=1 Tax=Escherichia coli TaxID=562 RepID=A0A376TKX9_ECOLX|nr:ferrochelatase [Escherichia coli]